MRLRQTRQGVKAPSQGSGGSPNASTGTLRDELGALLERQRAELEGCVADAERRATQAHEEANKRVGEIQRRSEERIEAGRRAAQERVAEAERLLKEAEQRAVNAETRLKQDGPRRRARRKLNEARQALEQERVTGRRLSEERERLKGELRNAEEQERELRQTLAAERTKLEGRVKELESRVRELEATLEKEREVVAGRAEEWDKLLEEAGAEHAREHNYRRALEDRLAAELLKAEEIRTQLDTEVAVATAERQRVQQLERELREARQQTSTERVERQRLEQRLEALLQAGTGAPPAPEQRSGGDGQGSAEAVEREQTAESSPDEHGRIFDRPHAAAQPGSVDNALANERPGNGQPRSAPNKARAKEGSRESGRSGLRWRRRSSLPCAVCQRGRPATGGADLTASGWALKGPNALCPACQEDGWQFPAEAAVPFRRVDARSPD
jgi:hypothetical protein